MLNLNDMLLLLRLIDAWSAQQQSGHEDWSALLLAHGDDLIRLVALICERPDAATMPLDEAVDLLNQRAPDFIDRAGAYLGEKVLPGVVRLQALSTQLDAAANPTASRQ